MNFGLDRMKRALRALHLEILPFRAVQVVGTNGKGSTSSFIASLAQAYQCKTGLYTSPHFLSPRERIRINGRMIDKALWVECANDALEAEPDLTYFELLTVMALLAFQRCQVQLAVIEAGLGGHYDATTALAVDAVAITPIDLDHEAILGHSIQAIAEDKSHAIRNQIASFTGLQQPEAEAILKKRAETEHSSLDIVSISKLPTIHLGLWGSYQKSNAALALHTWHYILTLMQQDPDPAADIAGLENVRFAGRFQYIKSRFPYPPLILDGAHNPHGLQAFQKNLQDLNIVPSALIFSCLKDKDVDSMLPMIRAIAMNNKIYVPLIPHNERAANPQALAEKLGDQAVPCASIKDALFEIQINRNIHQQNQPVCILGSLYLLSEYYRIFPQDLEFA
ncbi:MAG: Mur ligase family protein [Desulfovibrionaceae bacterium]|nr:Mur ligase family protein [Desulfovibrionaceae bacterium]